MPHQSTLQLGSTKVSYQTEAAHTFKGAGGVEADRKESKNIRDKYMIGDNMHFGKSVPDYQTQAVLRESQVNAQSSNTMAAKQQAN
jgi:hypothetical protein